MNNIPNNENCIYNITGVRGKSIRIYDNKCVINTKPTLGSFFAQNMTDGEKTIYYSDCIGVQFKKAGFTIGYLQFETATSMMNNRNSNFFGENSFTFDVTKISNEEMEKVAEYVKKRIDDIKKEKENPKVITVTSSADDIKKFKELLDAGIITQEEFEAKKKQILGL